MPSIEENRTRSETADWSRRGDEWSHDWGTSDAEWYGSLLPRIHQWLPVRTMLEIAPGLGRWTKYLKDYADRLIIVDVSPRCIEGCRARFRGESHIEYHANDGRSLPMVAEQSVDFVFSFDSLVHVDEEVLSAYLAEIKRILTKDGVAFLHHSNIGAHTIRLAFSKMLPDLVHRVLRRSGLALKNFHWRAEDVSAEVFAEKSRRAGLVCRSQEIFSWDMGRLLTDCISVVTLPSSRWAQPTRRMINPRFTVEARQCKERAVLYEQ